MQNSIFTSSLTLDTTVKESVPIALSNTFLLKCRQVYSALTCSFSHLLKTCSLSFSHYFFCTYIPLHFSLMIFFGQIFSCFSLINHNSLFSHSVLLFVVHVQFALSFYFHHIFLGLSFQCICVKDLNGSVRKRSTKTLKNVTLRLLPYCLGNMKIFLRLSLQHSPALSQRESGESFVK